jgi:hypothetical protein
VPVTIEGMEVGRLTVADIVPLFEPADGGNGA